MLNDYQILRPLINNIVHDERFKNQEFSDDKILEVHLSASSIIRKDFTINRIKNLIAKHKLNLKVFEDDTMEFNDRFIISKK
ncbi:MAG TPA: hypothetical protein VN703_09840 [Candidatus Sulfopaludibacter sp.]|nr:hypothetical protein [Candidatus Sulfopaludibacter sp.]